MNTFMEEKGVYERLTKKGLSKKRSMIEEAVSSLAFPDVRYEFDGQARASEAYCLVLDVVPDGFAGMCVDALNEYIAIRNDREDMYHYIAHGAFSVAEAFSNIFKKLPESLWERTVWDIMDVMKEEKGDVQGMVLSYSYLSKAFQPEELPERLDAIREVSRKENPMGVAVEIVSRKQKEELYGTDGH